MFRQFLFVVIGMTILIGCAARSPVAPDTGRPSLATQQYSPSDDCHRLWGEFKFFIDAAHDRVDVVPMREGRFHLNALKFLESYCTDCLQITKIKNNGDGTIDLTVQITHPFKGHPEYTGFDVKGIIMFNGSHELTTDDGKGNSMVWHLAELPIPEPITRLSWRELGDPQVLNADGYARRWALSYESGSSLPMFNYWKGKYANGEPNADVNAFLNFYTKEDRHVFEVNYSVSRTYKIWLPPGKPVVAGYAVEACWEPASKTPVTNPIADFPTSANQAEAYYANWVINNGEPIKYESNCCNGGSYDCEHHRLNIKQWAGITPDYDYIFDPLPSIMSGYTGSEWLQPCDPPQDGVLAADHDATGADGDSPPGKHQLLYAIGRQPDDQLEDICFTVVEFTIIE